MHRISFIDSGGRHTTCVISALYNCREKVYIYYTFVNLIFLTAIKVHVFKSASFIFASCSLLLTLFDCSFRVWVTAEVLSNLSSSEF